MISTVLDGELAVPCNPQPASVGSKAWPRPVFFWFVSGCEALTVGALRKEPSGNPARTGR